MKESIKLYVLREDDSEQSGAEAVLEFEYHNDSVGFILDGRSVCGLDWTENLRPALERALELWPAEELEPGEGR